MLKSLTLTTSSKLRSRLLSNFSHSSQFNNALSGSADRAKFRQLQFFRAAIGCILTVFLAQTIDFGISSTLLVCSIIVSGLVAGLCLKKQLPFLSITIWHFLAAILIHLALNLTNSLLLSFDGPAGYDFLIPRFSDNLLLLGVFYLLGFLSTWLFWTRTAAVSIEGFSASALVVWLLGGHRNYRLDSPKQISSLSWKVDYLQQIGAQPQHLILALGVVFVSLLIFYFALSSNRPIFGRSQTVKSFGPRPKLASVACPLVVVGALFYYAWYLNANYSVNLGRASNGVSAESNLKEGESNLGFNSAVTATKQPAAILRFEGDYRNNPWAPMLYLREGALSSFAGKELVRAGNQYDNDVPNVPLGQAFAAPESEPGPNRQAVVQSIYLITKHEAPFALDIPKRIRPIANPKPERFRLAYQALSHAPAKPLEEIMDSSVGEESWDKTTWEHYLRAPGSLGEDPSFDYQENEETGPIKDKQGEDLRYRALSKKLTAGIDNPVMRAASVIQYLSKESIYTRSPGHQVSDTGDPVSPYLFAAKKRGYCVHFAHAAVYLMRLAGVPARIATGYQTDLTYAKDGHVLLMMGDRHAWPEIYIRGHGWLAFDITPAQAENEPELVPDENLLEQLMGELDEAPEFAPPLPESENDKSKAQAVIARLLTMTHLLVLSSILLLGLLLSKLYLLYGYRFANDDRKRARLAYASFATRMADVGLSRNFGETRQEFVQRIKLQHGISADDVLKATEKANYAKNPQLPNIAELDSALENVKKSLKSSLSKLRRVIAALNPLSVFHWRSL